MLSLKEAQICLLLMKISIKLPLEGVYFSSFSENVVWFHLKGLKSVTYRGSILYFLVKMLYRVTKRN